MSLNVEDPKVISDAIAQLQAAGQAVINLAIDRLINDVVPKLETAADQTVANVRQDAGDLVASTMSQASTLVASLDGWSLTIDPITIRLSKPKPPAQ
jgi:hypothetical protein